MSSAIDISFAVPLYNKRGHILSVVESIFCACGQSDFNFEIVITENSSTDLESSLEDIIGRRDWLEKVKITYLPKTISCGENWALALGLCTGNIVKLQLADDRLCRIDINKLVNTFYADSGIDYIIGKTFPTIETQHASELFVSQVAEYFDNVNRIRKQVVTCPDQRERISILFEEGFFSGVNLLGDVNCLFLRRECLPNILLSQQLGYSPSTWMDWEMLLASVILREGAYLDEFVSEYSFNNTTNAVMSSSNNLTRLLQFDIPQTRAQLAFIIDPGFREYIYPLLNSSQRKQLTLDAMSMLIKTDEAALSTLIMTNKSRILKVLLSVLSAKLVRHKSQIAS